MCWVETSMEFINKLEPDVKKPLVIAAMQDMGNVGSIVINFINKHMRTVPFVMLTRLDYLMFMIREDISKFQKKNGNTDIVMM